MFTRYCSPIAARLRVATCHRRRSPKIDEIASESIEPGWSTLDFNPVILKAVRLKLFTRGQQLALGPFPR